jgi:hypothetical protein
VVPGMGQVSTAASSQNAARGAAVPLGPPGDDSSRQSMQGWSGIRCAAGADLCMS